VVVWLVRGGMRFAALDGLLLQVIQQPLLGELTARSQAEEKARSADEADNVFATQV
jgi:hypothetical protein